MIVDEKIEVEQKGDVFFITRHIVDKLTAKQYVENYKQVDDAIMALKGRLEGLDTEKDNAKKLMEEQLKELAPREAGLKQMINQAKITNERIKAEEKRTPEKAKEVSFPA